MTTTSRGERRPPRMKGFELVEEIEWLLDGGVHPLMICTQLGRSAEALERVARTHGRPDLARKFWPVCEELRAARRRARARARQLGQDVAA